MLLAFYYRKSKEKKNHRIDRKVDLILQEVKRKKTVDRKSVDIMFTLVKRKNSTWN